MINSLDEVVAWWRKNDRRTPPVLKMDSSCELLIIKAVDRTALNTVFVTTLCDLLIVNSAEDLSLPRPFLFHSVAPFVRYALRPI